MSGNHPNSVPRLANPAITTPPLFPLLSSLFLLFALRASRTSRFVALLLLLLLFSHGCRMSHALNIQVAGYRRRSRRVLPPARVYL